VTPKPDDAGMVIEAIEQALPIDDIELSDENVRKHEVLSDLDGLERSIGRIGVIQPVIVLRHGNKFSLISGQRRYYASKAVGKKTIPALIIGKVSPEVQRLISFGENIHRRELPYEDTVRVVGELFDSYPGSPRRRVQRIADDLGLSGQRTAYYLAHRIVPKEVQRLVTTKQLSRDQALALATSFIDQPDKIAAIARETPKLTKPEKERVVEISQRKPKAAASEIVAEARKPPTQVKITIYVDGDTHTQLEQLAQRRNFADVSSLVKSLVDELVRGQIHP
jgi:ParB/RepB/Spo0J family partition protein